MSEIAEGRYYIQLSSGRSLEAGSDAFNTNGAKIQTWKLYHGLNQLWEVRRATADTYHLFNVGGNRVLDAHGPDVNRNGCRVQLYELYPRNRNQQWILQSLGSNRYAIRCAASRDDKVIQIKDNVIDRSGEAELSDFLGKSSQIWTFTSSSDAAIVQSNCVDLRPNQTPMKDQGERGTCTYFGATAALEAAYKKAGYGDVDLSEEFWSIMGKALAIHPYWDDISHANYRENQFAGTQGSGTVRWYSKGFRIPKESDVAYRPLNYYPSNWDSLDQKVTNDFNFSMFTRNVLRAQLYYGARSVFQFEDAQLNRPDEYERVLSIGFEISIAINGGSHNVIMVGFDKTNSEDPVFFIKNSYGPLRGDPRIYCERRAYSELLPGITHAEYLTDVTEPSAWPELAFQGRWNIIFDGHKGTLDIYHIPGIGIIPEPPFPDKRLGVFYDTKGKAFRVNGSVSGNKIEFWFDGTRPNLRWDELRGRRFVYYLEPTMNLMAGYHYDNDKSEFGGYATKDSLIVHNSPRRNNFSAFPNSTWNVLIGDSQGFVHFGRLSGSCVHGVMTSIDGRTKNVEVCNLEGGKVSFWVEGSSEVATGLFLNHEAGLVCGNTVNGRPFYAAYRTT